MNEQLANQIRSAPNLPSLPAIAIQVLELTHKPDADMVELARIISKDPALSGKILRTVNSSFYGRPHHVSTISQALVILGLQSVRTLVLGFSLVANLSKDKSRGFDHLTYWKRSVFSAAAAHVLAAKIGLVEQEEAFLAGLLADIGMLVLDQIVPEQYGPIHAGLTSHEQLAAAEQAALGTTHAQVGGMLAELWKLPPVLSAPIAHHHDFQSVTDPATKKLAALVALAGRCADVFVDVDAAPAIADVRKILLEEHKLPESDCDTLMGEIAKRTREVAKLFEINLGSVAEYEMILRKATETLVEITMQSQQQAATLQEQNRQLQQRATTDGLTRLSNRARFDEFIAEQFKLACARSQPLALLMLDLDKFKSINDKHGHPTGDAVLKAVANILLNSVRKQDLAARYGGEELAVVMPGANRATAAAFAETLRRAIAAKPLFTGKINLPVTASIGVAVFEPDSPLKTAAHLIKAADLAVYNAKHSGRNCVRVLSFKLSAPSKSPTAATAPAA